MNGKEGPLTRRHGGGRRSEAPRLGVLLALASAACAGEAGEPAERAEPGSTRDVVACEVARVPLTIEDGTHPYVEPEALLRLGEGLLVAGTPTYTWADGPGGATTRVTTDAHVAARFGLDGAATLVEKPIPGAIGSVRPVALGGERWGLLFDEVVADSLPGRAIPLGLWYGEHDGERWARLERLPEPPEGRPVISGSTELVRAGDDLVWIVPARVGLDSAHQAVEYTRSAGRWRQRVISGAAIEVAALAFDPSSGLWWAQFSEDPDLPGWQQSLRLYRRVGGWELVRRVAVLPEGDKVRDPRVTPTTGGVSVSWRVEGAEDLGAYAVLDIGSDGGGRRLTLDSSVSQIMALRAGDGGPEWLVVHQDESGPSPELRLLEPGRVSVPERRLTTVSPYLGFLAAASHAPSEVLVVGPQYSADPTNQFLRSLIIRLSTSCT